jgi:hypothetical protein
MDMLTCGQTALRHIEKKAAFFTRIFPSAFAPIRAAFRELVRLDEMNFPK